MAACLSDYSSDCTSFFLDSLTAFAAALSSDCSSKCTSHFFHASTALAAACSSDYSSLFLHWSTAFALAHLSVYSLMAFSAARSSDYSLECPSFFFHPSMAFAAARSLLFAEDIHLFVSSLVFRLPMASLTFYILLFLSIAVPTIRTQCLSSCDCLPCVCLLTLVDGFRGSSLVKLLVGLLVGLHVSFLVLIEAFRGGFRGGSLAGILVGFLVTLLILVDEFPSISLVG